MFGKKVNEEDFNNIDLGEFEEKYSEKGLWEKIQGNLAAIGAGLVYKALQLFYVAQSPQCPMKIKAAIYGALGYLISPLDLIPDFTPFGGDAFFAPGAYFFFSNDDIKAGVHRMGRR